MAGGLGVAEAVGPTDGEPEPEGDGSAEELGDDSGFGAAASSVQADTAAPSSTAVAASVRTVRLCDTTRPLPETVGQTGHVSRNLTGTGAHR